MNNNHPQYQPLNPDNIIVNDHTGHQGNNLLIQQNSGPVFNPEPSQQPLSITPIIFSPSENLMTTNLNIYGMLWGKGPSNGPSSNFRSFFEFINKILNTVLISIAIITYKPDTETQQTTQTGKKLLLIAAFNGLFTAVMCLIESVFLV
jgi:hypothetical protein